MRMVIWGIGEHCEDRLYCYPQLLDDVVAFIDGAEEKWGKMYYGKPVKDPTYLLNNDFDLLLIAAQKAYFDIKQICIEIYNIDKSRIRTIDNYITDLLISGNMEPAEVCIDASTICQLNCVQCYMRKDHYGKVGCGYLTFENFKKFIDANPMIRTIELANSGEVFLNPELDRIIEYAYERDIRLSAWDGVNFNTVSDEMLELLVKKRFRMITIALDGASQETYVKYRRNGNFDCVIENIRKLNRLKEKYSSPYPKLIWQYIIMESTENDIEKAKAMAKELDMTIKFRLTWDYSFRPKNPEKIKESTGLEYVTRSEYDGHHEKKCMTGCLQFFTRPQINWDGRLLGCKCIYQEDFGLNVFEQSIRSVMNDEKIVSAKELIKGKTENLKDKFDYPCKHCKFFAQMYKNNSFVVPEDFY